MTSVLLNLLRFFNDPGYVLFGWMFCRCLKKLHSLVVGWAFWEYALYDVGWLCCSDLASWKVSVWCSISRWEVTADTFNYGYGFFFFFFLVYQLLHDISCGSAVCLKCKISVSPWWIDSFIVMLLLCPLLLVISFPPKSTLSDINIPSPVFPLLVLD